MLEGKCAGLQAMGALGGEWTWLQVEVDACRTQPGGKYTLSDTLTKRIKGEDCLSCVDMKALRGGDYVASRPGWLGWLGDEEG